ncbi:MAG: peptide-methionine (R)-S-oxide reductase, partial [Bacteroidetes bacterium]|nr:peptide-methionine (R)-S-oxide reductase [Bacteroidota bacterium]
EDGKDNEIVCGRCHSHMGYLLMDGPTATKKHYALNGDILDFEAGKPGEIKPYNGAQNLADK